MLNIDCWNQIKETPLPHINKPLESGSWELQCKGAGLHGLKDITFPGQLADVNGSKE